MLIENSKDILFIVMAVCILWITVFFCWLLYYFVMTAKRMHDVVRGAKEKVDKAGEVLDVLKKRIETGASYLGAIVEATARITDYIKTKDKKGKK